MNCRQMALMLGVAASCAGCVTETKTVPVSAETMAKMKDIKEAEHPKRDAQAVTWVAIGRMHEAKAAEAQGSAVESGRWRDEARKAYTKAIELEPTNVEAQLALADFWLKQDDTDRAIEACQRALQLNPRAAPLWYEEGCVYLRRQDLKNAAQYLGRAHELEPLNRDYAMNFGLCLARGAAPQEAVKVLSGVMTKADANLYVARMMKHMQRTDLAWQYTQLALVERPTHPEALAFLAQFGRPASLQGPVATESSPEPEFQRARFAPDW